MEQIRMKTILTALLIATPVTNQPAEPVETEIVLAEDVKKKKKKGKKIGGSKGKKSKKGFFSKIFGSK